MEELNQIRTQLRNRLLICFGCVVVLGIAAALVVKHAFVFFFVLVLGCILSMLVVQKPRKRYRTAFKQAFVRKSLESVFTDLEYEPDAGISYETIADTKMMSMGDRFHSEDYISGRYRNIFFEQSDVHIEEKHESTDSKGHTTTSYVTLFRGRWMIFDFNKEFRAKLQVVQKGFPSAKRKRFFGKKENLFKKVELESEAFNHAFQVYAQNEHDAFYVITPAFMERIQNLAARNTGKLLFCFIDNRLHIAIHDNKDSFEPGSVFRPIDEQASLDKIRSEIQVITQFVDELELDNNLFLMEE